MKTDSKIQFSCRRRFASIRSTRDLPPTKEAATSSKVYLCRKSVMKNETPRLAPRRFQEPNAPRQSLQKPETLALSLQCHSCAS